MLGQEIQRVGENLDNNGCRHMFSAVGLTHPVTALDLALVLSPGSCVDYGLGSGKT